MNVALAQALVDLAGIYFGIGLLFAITFVTFAAGRIDPAAAAGSMGFRILILPGSALLWPVLARRCLTGRSLPRPERDPHTDAARAGGRR